MKILLPRRTNITSIPRELLFKRISKSMSYKDEEEIKDQNNKEYTKQQYERMGIKIIEEYDNFSYLVELPEGWEFKDGNYYWKYVVDNKGKLRISFFNKAPFYDKEFFCNFYHRYSFIVLPFDEYKTDATIDERRFKPWKLFLTDNGKNVKIIKEMVANTKEEYFKNQDKLREIGIEFLNKNYPDWKNINAYWD